MADLLCYNWPQELWSRLTLSLLHILATKQDIEDHFSSHGTGKITEIKLMNGFGFIEYEDAMDARDIVPGQSYPIAIPISC